MSSVKEVSIEETPEDTRAVDWWAASMGERCEENTPDSWEKMWEETSGTN